MLFSGSDERLIEKALNGSQGSWVSLVKRYEGLVYNYCLRMSGQPSDAMDLMQEVFLSVYRHLPSYRGQGQFKSWMMRIASNKSIDFLRARGRAPQTADSDDETDVVDLQPARVSDNPDARYESTSRNREIMQVMARLPAEQRMVVELKFFQHYTFDEISEQTGISVNTVKSRLYSALQKLKQHLEVQNVM